MLNAIRTAQTNITFETFVFRDGVGATFVEELSAAARRGVQVHMLLDWLGSRTMEPQPAAGRARRRLRAAPVSPAVLVPPRPPQQPHAPQAHGDRRLAWASPAASAWASNGRMAATGCRPGAKPISRPRDRWSRRCRPCSSTTGSRPRAACCTAPNTSPGSRPAATWTRRCSAARRSAARRACT